MNQYDALHGIGCKVLPISTTVNILRTLEGSCLDLVNCARFKTTDSDEIYTFNYVALNLDLEDRNISMYFSLKASFPFGINQ